MTQIIKPTANAVKPTANAVKPFVPPYVPHGDLEQVQWMHNFAMVLTNIADKVGVSDPQVAQVQADALAVAWSIESQLAIARTNSQSATAAKNALLFDANQTFAGWMNPATPPTPPAPVANGVFHRVDALVRDIRKSPGFTPEIAKALKIIPIPKPEVADVSWKSFKSLPNWAIEVILLKYNWQQIEVESQRGDEAQWWMLDKIITPRLLDARAPLVAGKPEERRYRFKGCMINGTCSEWSSVLTLVTRP